MPCHQIQRTKYWGEYLGLWQKRWEKNAKMVKTEWNPSERVKLCLEHSDSCSIWIRFLPNLPLWGFQPLWLRVSLRLGLPLQRLRGVGTASSRLSSKVSTLKGHICSWFVLKMFQSSWKTKKRSNCTFSHRHSFQLGSAPDPTACMSSPRSELEPELRATCHGETCECLKEDQRWKARKNKKK